MELLTYQQSTTGFRKTVDLATLISTAMNLPATFANKMIRSFFLFLLPTCLLAQPDLKKPFGDCGLTGSITIYDYKNEQWIRSNATDSDMATLPASTFKIINTLIALETGVIEDESVVVRWPSKTDTTLYGYRPDIYHDMTVKEAFAVSADWVYIELAKKIGKEPYRQLMETSGYGNADLSQPADDFWNYGGFGVTPNQQVQLLINLYEGKLPFTERSMEIVKRMMIAESTPDYVLRSKTGWTIRMIINLWIAR